ncbi:MULTISPECIES: hypothetical protein [unclassified Lactobacillus]|uniref:hypothetical protein n=1 Tax=unclassified Lactobacillus TaxID=2620435 RepID=UPI000EFA9E9B|nr:MULTISPECIES: hypothetical protein [unclassified Lactobacillus]RMC23525.1 hypothetical protein F5ESL0247_07815 [Lactobacillus sp. ESL0247]RMC27322.1 hypothetical protein F5ESL0246_07815 [Lactobacillus sp. ESL0246]RMC30387.1 hypothetical protein F5ESL0245_07815 [Lactobacillus sp. ESL0245]
MSKRKIELNEKVEKLAAKYLKTYDIDLDTLTNKALKAYLIDHLSSSQIKEALRENDNTSSNYSGRLFPNNIDDLNL